MIPLKAHRKRRIRIAAWTVGAPAAVAVLLAWRQPGGITSVELDDGRVVRVEKMGFEKRFFFYSRPQRIHETQARLPESMRGILGRKGLNYNHWVLPNARSRYVAEFAVDPAALPRDVTRPARLRKNFLPTRGADRTLPASPADSKIEPAVNTLDYRYFYRFMSSTVATKLRKGQAISVSGEKGIILDLVHRTPGKGNALIMATVRSFASGKTKDIRFASNDKVELLNVHRSKLEFSYQDGDSYCFMDPNTYDTTELPGELVKDIADMITENTVVEVVTVEGSPVSVELPATVDLKVEEAAEGLKGDTVNNPQKPATLETGKVVQVPLFVKVGDVITVDTRTGKYMGRA